MPSTSEPVLCGVLVAAAFVPGCESFQTGSLLPRTAGSLLARNSAYQVLSMAPTRQPVCASVSMMAEGGRMSKVKALVSRVSKGALLGLAVSVGVMAPRSANAAREALADVDFGMSSDGTVLYEPVQIKKSVTFETFGVAAGAAAASFTGAAVVAIKKEKKLVQEDIDGFEREAERMEQFKQEFLDGIVSDRSLLASLNKAVKTKAPEAAKPAKEEDEFEKNVQAFLDEEREKEEQKNKPEWNVAKGGPTILERPGDVDGSKTEEWMNDIDFEDKPAEIDSEQLKRLQRMFGGEMPKLD